jgi:hypothetical protein
MKFWRAGGIIGIFYIGGFVFPVGESVLTFYLNGAMTEPTPFKKMHVSGINTNIYPNR